MTIFELFLTFLVVHPITLRYAHYFMCTGSPKSTKFLVKIWTHSSRWFWSNLSLFFLFFFFFQEFSWSQVLEGVWDEENTKSAFCKVCLVCFSWKLSRYFILRCFTWWWRKNKKNWFLTWTQALNTSFIGGPSEIKTSTK